jgi:hypothetical protein
VSRKWNPIVALAGWSFAILMSAPTLPPAGFILAADGPSVATAASSSWLVGIVAESTRAAKGKTATAEIDRAKEMVSAGADVNTCDPHGLSPLHWAVIGAVNADTLKRRQAFTLLIEQLLAAGADINAEDGQGNTALDWQAVNPNDEIEALLVENGGRYGLSQNESARVNHLLAGLVAASDQGDLAGIRSLLEISLPPGTELQVRLTTPVSTKDSSAGDPIEAVVIEPVRVGQRLMVSAGTPIEGFVMLSRRAPNQYEHADLTLDFANLVHPSGARTRLATRLIAVDNARETVRDGHITGFAYPHTFLDKLSWGIRAVGLATPALGYALQAATWGYGHTLDREIHYPAGVDMTLRVLLPERLAELPPESAGPSEMAVTPELAAVLRRLPLQTQTPSGDPSDITNVVLLGSREAVDAAFTRAGWAEAAKLGTTSGVKTFLATIHNKGYEEAPVSTLLLDGRKPDIVYQKQNNTFSKRHHVRLWRQPATLGGRPLWVGSATHDIGIASTAGGTKWYHRIDPRIDRERAKIATDLSFAGAVTGQALAEREDLPRDLRNATGDRLETDGRILVLELAEPKQDIAASAVDVAAASGD